MILTRFFINKVTCGGDYRPVEWPIKYPYWCTGESYDENGDLQYFTLVAYADSIKQIQQLWPDAQCIIGKKVSGIEFSDRFPKPEWYNEENGNIQK